MNVGRPRPKQYSPRKPDPHNVKKRRRKHKNGAGDSGEQVRTRTHQVSRRQTRLRFISRSSGHHEHANKKRSAVKVDTRITLNPTSSLNDMMTVKPGANFKDTIPHRVMLPTTKGLAAGIEGEWHVKKPGRISKIQMGKRYLISLLMKARSKLYKSKYFHNTKTLVEKEILAGKLTQLTHIKGPTFAQIDWELAEDMKFGHFKDEDGEDCIACRHIDHDYMATREAASRLVYDGEHNPATAYVQRRYMMGDEDAVKKANYLVKRAPLPPRPGTQKKPDPPRKLHCFVSIDHGYALYNRSDVVADMSFKEFVHWSLELPLSHKLHYSLIKRGESIMELIDGMRPVDKTRAVYMALAKMGSVTDDDLDKLCLQISDPVERLVVLEDLKIKTFHARRMMQEAETLPEIKILL